MIEYNGLSDNVELNKFYKVENIRNTGLVELQETDGKKPDGLGFTSDLLLNSNITLLNFDPLNGLEEYNKLEKR